MRVACYVSGNYRAGNAVIAYTGWSARGMEKGLRYRCKPYPGIGGHSLYALFLFAMMLHSVPLSAQPVLNLKRIVNNWPTIELYFWGSCNGEISYGLTCDNFILHENGINIPEFTVWCPDPKARCPISLAYGIDISTADAHAKVTETVQSFMNFYKPPVDEGALVWFESYFLRELGMTNQISSIMKKVRNIPLSNGSRYVDVAYASLEALIAGGNNPCRGVILITDGKDSLSYHSIQDVIQFANRNRIQVFSIQVGDAGDVTDLQLMALLTGGKFYSNPSPDQIVNIYHELTTVIFCGFYEPIITYQATCMNGALRTVDLTLKGFCNGSDTKTKTYRAPKDTSTYGTLAMGLEGVAFATTEQYTVPFSVLEPAAGSVVDGFEVDIEFDTQQFEVSGMKVPPATLLQNPGGMMYSITSTGAHVTYLGGIESGLTGGLFFIDFVKRSPAASDTLIYRITEGSTYNSCLLIRAIEDTIFLADEIAITITALDQSVKCAPASVKLHASTGFSEYRWSNGDSSQTIEVHQSGRYSVTATSIGGGAVQSDTIDVSIHEPTIPKVTVEGNPERCYGDSVRLSAGGGFASCVWSNGSEDSSIVVYKSGSYWVKTTNDYGCVYQSPAATVSIEPEVEPHITGAAAACPDEFQEYKVSYSGGNAVYNWQVSGGVIADGLGSHTILVQWQNDTLGCVYVTAQYAACTYTDSLQVNLHIADKPVIIVDGPRSVCMGRETVLKADANYQYCHWNTGDRTLSIAVSKPGVYIMEAGNSQQCLRVSDTVMIGAAPVTKPVVSRRGDTLFATSGHSYQWLESDSPIQDATDSFYVLQEPGSYTVIVSNEYGCIAESDVFDAGTLIFENTDEPAGFSLDVFPSVVRDRIVCNVRCGRFLTYTCSIYDISGNLLYSEERTTDSGVDMFTLSLQGIPQGSYFVKVHSSHGSVLKRILKL